MAASGLGPNGGVLSDRFLLLQRFLENPPPQANFNTMYQTTAFVKGEDKVSFREQASTVTKVGQAGMTESSSALEKTVIDLMNKYEEHTDAYKFKRSNMKVISKVNRIGTFLGGAIGGTAGKAFMKSFLTVSALPYKSGLKHHEKESRRYADHIADLIATEEEKAIIRKAPIEVGHKMLRERLVKAFPGFHQMPEHERKDYIGFLARIINKVKGKPKPSKEVLKLPPETIIRQTIVMINQMKETPHEIEYALRDACEEVRSIHEDFQAIQNRLNHIDQQGAESQKIIRFLADIQYKNLTTADKIEGLKRNIYPDHIGELKTLELIHKWEKAEKTMKVVVGVASQGIKLLGQLGVKLPKHADKIPLAGQAAFHVIKGISTSNPMEVVQAVGEFIGLFRSSGPDISTLRHQQLVDLLSNVIDNQEIMFGMIEHLQKQIDQLFQLNLEIARAVNDIGIVILKNHAAVMAKLHIMHQDLLYLQSVVVHAQLQFFHEFQILEEARREAQCHQGVFETHEGAQAFFHDHIYDYNQALDQARFQFSTDQLSPLLLFNNVMIGDDADEVPGTKSYFLKKVWANSSACYQEFLQQELDHKKRENMFFGFLEPMVLFDDLLPLLEEKIEPITPEFQKIVNFCNGHLNQLVFPPHILRTGAFVLDFHRYDPLIKNFTTGELFSVDEILNGLNVLGPKQKRGRRLLESLLSHLNLSIFQQHLLSGGPLIPRLCERFFDRLSDYTAMMNAGGEAATPEKAALREQMINTVNALAYNPMLARNTTVYAIRTHLGINNTEPDRAVKCFNYRWAYNHSSDPTQLHLLFPGWDFIPSPDEHGQAGWALRTPFAFGESQQELRLQLPHPNDVYHGKLLYPVDLLQLINLREEIVSELACSDLHKLVDLEQKKLLAERIISII